MFKDVFYVPSLATNLLSVYQMTHTSSPKRVVFGPDSVEITNISTRNIIAKGVANISSKAYEFSHFMAYSDPAQPQLPFERGGKKILSTPFVFDVLSNVSDSEDEEQDQHDIDIEIEHQNDLDPYLAPIPNQKPKWAQKLIEAARNVVGDLDDRRRARYQYQNEHVALSYSISIP